MSPCQCRSPSQSSSWAPWGEGSALAGVRAASAAAGAAADTVRGQVTASDGRAVAGANVFLVETLAVALSDDSGGFTFVEPAGGAFTLVVVADGFREWRGPVTLPAAAPLLVRLGPEVVRLAPIEVQAGRFVVTDAPDAALSALDVVTTPGTQADVYRTWHSRSAGWATGCTCATRSPTMRSIARCSRSCSSRCSRTPCATAFPQSRRAVK